MGKAGSAPVRVVRGQDHVEAEIDGQTAMLSLDQGHYYAVEGTAQRIWELIASPVTADELVDALVEEYDVDPATCRASVDRFLRRLLDAGLAREVPR